MKGIYLLFIEVDEPVSKKVGALGEIHFQDGTYIYVGSAQKNLEARISRHFSSSKTKYWHIDYLLEDENLKKVIAYELGGEKECEIAQYLDNKFTRVSDFGCSDCNCASHLFFSKKNSDELLEEITGSIDTEPLRSEDLDIQ
ncbi:MAG: GIY-YIG nuclease family protein [Thermoplasmata archaeon]